MTRKTATAAALTAATLTATGLLLTACESTPNASGNAPAAPPAGDAGAHQPLTVVERSALRERAIETLVAMLQSPDPQLRANAIEGLAAAPGRVRPAVSLGLADQNEGVRAVAAAVAGRAGLTDMASPLRSLTNDPSPFVRAAAIAALARMGQPVDRTPLANLLLEHPSPRVRAHAAYNLGEIGDPSALPVLRQASVARIPSGERNEITSLQLQIAEAMVKLGDADAIQSIRAALYPAQPADLEMAALAIQIIGQLRDQSSAGQLKYLSAYTDGKNMMPAEVRLAIADAMARLGQREGWFIADNYAQSQTPAIRAQVAHVYGQTNRPSNAARLAGLLEDPAGIVRAAAAAAIVESLGSGSVAGVPG